MIKRSIDLEGDTESLSPGFTVDAHVTEIGITVHVEGGGMYSPADARRIALLIQTVVSEAEVAERMLFGPKTHSRYMRKPKT